MPVGINVKPKVLFLCDNRGQQEVQTDNTQTKWHCQLETVFSVHILHKRLSHMHNLSSLKLLSGIGHHKKQGTHMHLPGMSNGE